MEENRSYHTVRKLTLGQSEIEVCIETIPTKEQIKKHLIKIYDVVNNIAKSAERRGVNTSKWFYTDNQIMKLKENPENNFI